MRQPERLPDGRLRVPAPTYGDGAIGDGVIEVGPGDELFELWTAYLAELGD